MKMERSIALVYIIHNMSVCLFVSSLPVSIVILSIDNDCCLSVCPFVCLSVCLSVYLYICLPICLSVCVYLFVCLSVCLSVRLSVYLSLHKNFVSAFMAILMIIMGNFDIFPCDEFTYVQMGSGTKSMW